ncbi:MAG: SPOR domain-containing protein [Acidobacteriaceae bacterium]
MRGTLFQEAGPVENELHLGTNSILAIFLGVTLVSAVFFGLGYSFGRTGGGIHITNPLHNLGSQAPATNAEGALPNGAASGETDSATAQKPSAMLTSAPAASGASTPPQPLALVPANDQNPATPSSTPNSASSVVGDAPIATVGDAPIGAASARPKSSPGPGYVVQVAAVASRKDAQTLVTELKQHGLTAKLRSGTHDAFFHVQIGPFATQQAAEAMRHKVIAAGHKAILKPAP